MDNRPPSYISADTDMYLVRLILPIQMAPLDLVSAFCKLLIALVCADFITGLFHFLEDNFGSEHTPIVGTLIKDNRRHHEKPTYLLQYTYWDTINTSVYAALVISAGWYALFQSFSTTYLLTALIGVHANLFHKYSHSSVEARPVLYRLLRAIGVFQRYHHVHHQAPYSTNYCVITDWLNTPLDYFGVWMKVRDVLLWCGLPPAS